MKKLLMLFRTDCFVSPFFSEENVNILLGQLYSKKSLF